MKHSILLGTMLLLMGLASAQGGLDEQLARTRAAYGVAAWPAGAVRDGLPLAALEIPGLRGGGVRSEGDFITREFTTADAPAGARPLLRLEARVCEDVQAAREVLVAWLAHLSSPHLAPEDGALGMELGEAGYVGPSGVAEGAVSWIAFVRGNVSVRLTNVDLRGAPELDVLSAARVVDAVIAERPMLGAGERPAPPSIARLAASASAVVAGQAPRLDVTAVDSSGGTATLQWHIAGDGQGYVELRDDGWHLFTTGPGTVDVTLIAIASTGTVAKRTVRIDVAPK